MKMLFLSLLLFLGLSADLKTEQLQFERVRTAFEEKRPDLNELLIARNLKWEHLELYLQAFKQEQMLEVWVRNRTDRQFQLLRSIPFCTTSGRPGPKNREGDKQIPEGFYYLNRFHPESKYYLSLGLDYPNQADRLRSKADKLGGNIFIHGKCASIGCIPITDDGIKWLYVLAVEAQQNGQAKIPVHIFPTRLTTSRLEELSAYYYDQPQLQAFWENLKTGYDYFQQHKAVPEVAVNKAGLYVFKGGK